MALNRSMAILVSLVQMDSMARTVPYNAIAKPPKCKFTFLISPFQSDSVNKFFEIMYINYSNRTFKTLRIKSQHRGTMINFKITKKVINTLHIRKTEKH